METISHPRLSDRPRNVATLLLVLAAHLLMTCSVWADLPNGWSDPDIGGPGVAGWAGYTNGNWTVRGGGSDIWNSADQFHYAYTTVNGDSTIIARVTS